MEGQIEGMDGANLTQAGAQQGEVVPAAAEAMEGKYRYGTVAVTVNGHGELFVREAGHAGAVYTTGRKCREASMAV